MGLAEANAYETPETPEAVWQTDLAKPDDGQGLSSDGSAHIGVTVPDALLHGSISLGHITGHGAHERNAVFGSGDCVGSGGVHDQHTILRAGKGCGHIAVDGCISNQP